MVEYLLKAKANTNLQNKQGLTPLMVAIDNDHDSIMNLLLKAGCKLHLQSYEKGYMALHHCVKSYDIDKVKLVLNHGAPVDCQDDQWQTPLITSIYEHQFDIPKYLIKKGANVSRAIFLLSVNVDKIKMDIIIDIIKHIVLCELFNFYERPLNS